MSRIIGLTGGICCGKSTVAELLHVKYSVPVIDADKLGHEAYESGTPCMEAIVAHFGESVRTADNQIDRKALGSLVFSSKAKMEELQALVWPLIRQKLVERIADLRSQCVPVILVEAAVMIEAGWQDLVDSVWVVCADPEIAIDRLMKRNSLTEEEARQRVSSQLTNQERSRHAHVILSNVNDINTFKLDISSAYELFVSM